jgi:hypothetical protein
MEIKWVTLDNETGEKTLKQHGFIAKERKRKYTGEIYTANVSLCRAFGGLRLYVVNENAEIEEWDKVEGELRDVNRCKLCAKIFSQGMAIEKKKGSQTY